MTAQTDHGYGRTEGSVLVGLGQQIDGVVVKLFPAARIIGKVMIEGSPPKLCVEARVFFRDEANDRWASATTDPDGTIHADGVLPGTYTAQVTCEGYRAKDHYPPTVVAGKDVVDQTWEVEIGAIVRGKVLGKSGQPIEDAEISARTNGGDVRAKSERATDRSQADGSYELRGMKPAAYKINVDTQKAVVPREGFKVEIPTPGVTVQKDLVLEDGGTIKGIVVDAQGKGVDDITVDARPLSGGIWWNQDEIRSDAKGEFVIEAVRAGDYRVSARRGWDDALRKPGTTDDDTQGEKVTVAVGKVVSVKLLVESQTGVIKGSVVNASGTPVSDAFISAARESDAAGARQSTPQSTRDFWGDEDKPVLTGVDGAFAVTKLAPGKYTLRAYRKGGGEALVEHIAVGSTARMQIKPTGSIEGVARRDGSPLPPRAHGLDRGPEDRVRARGDVLPDRRTVHRARPARRPVHVDRAGRGWPGEDGGRARGGSGEDRCDGDARGAGDADRSHRRSRHQAAGAWHDGVRAPCRRRRYGHVSPAASSRSRGWRRSGRTATTRGSVSPGRSRAAARSISVTSA